MDHARFTAPRRAVCPFSHHWQFIDGAYGSLAHTVKFGVLREVCACLSSKHRAAILWDGPPSLNANASSQASPVSSFEDDNRAAVFWPRWQRQGEGSTCEGSKRRQIRPGLSLVTHGWPSSASAQALCSQPMMQAPDADEAPHRLQYLAAEHRGDTGGALTVTPMVLGQFRALGTSLEVIRMEPGVSYCYDRVAVCQPSGARPAWQSIRRSQLKPERNGALLVPTRRAASQLSSKVRVMCGLQDAEDEVAYDDNGGSTVAWAPPRTARVIIRNHSSRPRLMDMPQVLRVMRKHFAHVEVLEVAASPSTADFCTQVGWMQRTDLVLTHHGSHVASAAYMQRGTHLIEVLPHRYERDDNGNGCAPRARHILVGRRTVASAELPAACRSLTAQQAILSRKCRKVFREAPVRVPLAELDVLLRRILSGRDSSDGQYLCDEYRCAYV